MPGYLAKSILTRLIFSCLIALTLVPLFARANSRYDTRNGDECRAVVNAAYPPEVHVRVLNGYISPYFSEMQQCEQKDQLANFIFMQKAYFAVTNAITAIKAQQLITAEQRMSLGANHEKIVKFPETAYRTSYLNLFSDYLDRLRDSCTELDPQHCIVRRDDYVTMQVGSPTMSDRTSETDTGLEPANQSGRLLPWGGYPVIHFGNSLTVLPDGAIFLYGEGLGHSFKLPLDQQTATLRNRGKLYSILAPDPAPLQYDPGQHRWQRLAYPPECSSQARFLHTATLLPDNKVLLAGGLCDQPKMANDATLQAPYTALSMWDATQRKWLTGAALQHARIYHSASLMPDGSVMFVGGESDPALSLSPAQPVMGSVERYGHGQIEQLPSLNVARARHTATVMSDGGLLVVGGFDENGRALDATELWEPDSKSWQTLAPLQQARYDHTATRLADGRVVVTGGIGADGTNLTSVEIWNPNSRRWTDGPSLPIPLSRHSVALLTSGQLLLASGFQGTNYSAPTPWAWSWNPATDSEWKLAGHIAPTEQEHLSGPITLAPRPDGGALVLGASAVMRWQPAANSWPSAAPAWNSPPTGTGMEDGRVMFIGRINDDFGNGHPVARVWNPAQDTWTDEGHLIGTESIYDDSIQLRGGPVIHVGRGWDNTLRCEAWMGNRRWQSCGTYDLEYESKSRILLGLLSDGRVFALVARFEILVLNATTSKWTPWKAEWDTADMKFGAPIRSEKPLTRIQDPETGQWFEINDVGARFLFRYYDFMPPSMLWDEQAGLWTYVFQQHPMGADAQVLPDGCVISMNSLALYNPSTGKVTALQDPGLMLDNQLAETVVLRDGTVVAAGAAGSAKDVGGGFFHGKASCNGFAPNAELKSYVVASTKENAFAGSAANAALASTVESPSAVTVRSVIVDKIGQFVIEHKWLVFAIAVPLIVYLLLRLAGATRVQVGPARVLRPVIYGSLLIYLVPAVWNYWNFHRLQADQTCMESAKCLADRKELLLPPAAAHGESASATLPCKYIGVWSSVRSGVMRRIELKDDGTYFMAPSQVALDSPTGYTGSWSVSGTNMNWHHDQVPGSKESNQIQTKSATQFTLTETDGGQTEFELIRAVPSTKCSQ